MRPASTLTHAAPTLNCVSSASGANRRRRAYPPSRGSGMGSCMAPNCTTIVRRRGLSWTSSEGDAVAPRLKSVPEEKETVFTVQTSADLERGEAPSYAAKRSSGSDAALPPQFAGIIERGNAKLADLVRSTLGVEPAPELLAIAMVYFVQGILGLSRLATNFYLKDELHLEPADLALIGGVAGIPWAIKPIYGFISDSFPLLGYKRRSYLVLCGFFGAGCWILLAGGPAYLPLSMVCFLGGSLSTAFSDVVVDSIVVERARGAPVSTAGSLQSLCWASSAVGAILSAYFSGSLVESNGSRFVFTLTALFPLIVASSAFLIDEEPAAEHSRREGDKGEVQEWDNRRAGEGRGAAVGETGRVQGGAGAVLGGEVDGGSLAAAQKPGWFVTAGENASTLWKALREKGILLPAVFLFMWQATPSASSAMFYFYTGELGFTPEFLGRVALVGAVSHLAGIGVYNKYLKKIPLRRLFFWTAILGAALSSTQLLLITRANLDLGLSDELFVLGDSVILAVLGQLSFMPVLVLAARVCPEGVEATLFATLMSLLNTGSFAGSALGSVFTKSFGVTSDNFDNLAALVALCCALQLLPLPLLRFVPESLENRVKYVDNAGLVVEKKREKE